MNTQENSGTRSAGRGRWKFFIMAGAVAVVLIAVVIIAITNRIPGPVEVSDVATGPVTADAVLARIRPLLRGQQGPDAPQADAMSRAIDIMAAYIERAPEDVQVRPLLAETQIKLRRFEDAKVTVDKLLELSPDASEGLWAKGKLLQAQSIAGSFEYFRRAAEAPDAGARQWASFGLAARDADQPQLAREYLARAVKSGLRERQVLAVLGELLISAAQPGDAEYFFTEALKLKGADQDGSLWSGLARAQQASGRPDKAVGTLTRAIGKLRRWNDRSAMMVELADSLAAIGRLDEAAEAYSAGSDGLPNSHTAALSAAKCYWQLGQYAQAMKYIDRAFELKRDSGEILQWKSKIERSRF